MEGGDKKGCSFIKNQIIHRIPLTNSQPPPYTFLRELLPIDGGLLLNFRRRIESSVKLHQEKLCKFLVQKLLFRLYINYPSILPPSSPSSSSIPIHPSPLLLFHLEKFNPQHKVRQYMYMQLIKYFAIYLCFPPFLSNLFYATINILRVTTLRGNSSSFPLPRRAPYHGSTSFQTCGISWN